MTARRASEPDDDAKVETCNESETVSSLMERMTSGKFRNMPVVDRGRVVGIVSIGDIVKAPTA